MPPRVALELVPLTCCQTKTSLVRNRSGENQRQSPCFAPSTHVMVRPVRRNKTDLGEFGINCPTMCLWPMSLPGQCKEVRQNQGNQWPCSAPSTHVTARPARGNKTVQGELVSIALLYSFHPCLTRTARRNKTDPWPGESAPPCLANRGGALT